MFVIFIISHYYFCCKCFAVVLAIVGGVALYAIGTPEFALVKLGLDVKNKGFDAVLPHLTDNAYNKS